MSTSFNDFLKEQLQDPEFRKEYKEMEPEHAIIQAIIDARRISGLTQKELSARTGIAQGDISKLENGSANPSLHTLQRLAEGMGMVLKMEFVPNKETLEAMIEATKISRDTNVKSYSNMAELKAAVEE